MAYINVTARWLREKVAQLTRMARLYVTSAEYEVYFARITADVATQAEQARSLRLTLDKAMAYLNDLESRQDNV
jgi:hypothetical protein